MARLGCWLLILWALATWTAGPGPVAADPPAAASLHVPAKHGVSIGPDEALAKLVAGNQRFAEGRPHRQHQEKTWRERLVEGQHPFATILGCSDSRVPPEYLFDQGFGDLFVVRVAGGVVGTDTAGSVEYAALHLGTPIVLVLGHEECGAVKSALDTPSIGSQASEVGSLLMSITPALAGIDPKRPFSERAHAGVEANVRRSVSRLSKLDALAPPLSSGTCKVVGAVYDLSTGVVRVLE